MPQQTKLKKGLNANAPIWMQNLTAILLILQSAKPLLIDGFPGIEEATKTLAGQYFDWIGNVVSVIVAIMTITSGTERKDKYIPMLLLLLSLSLLFSGCYSANKATKQVWKAQAVHPAVVRNACSELYPSHDSVHEFETLILGDTLVLFDTITSFDTVTNTLTNYIYKNVYKTDTLTRMKYVQVDNKAALETALEDKQLTERSLTAARTVNKYLWWIVVVLGIYTSVRWILRFWNIKLP